MATGASPFHSLAKTVSQKQYHILGDIAATSTVVKDKRCTGLGPVIFCSILCLVPTQSRSIMAEASGLLKITQMVANCNGCDR